MNPLETWILQYLVNSLWQIPLVAIAGLLIGRLLRPCGPAVAHRLWIAVLAVQATLPACTFDLPSWLPFLAFHPEAQNAGLPGQVTVLIGPGVRLGFGSMHPWLLTSLAILYSATSLFFAARLLLGMRRAATLRRLATPIALPPEAEAFLARCRLHFKVPEAAILASPHILGPITLGHRHPAILLPAGMSERITSTELQAALAHEFAHIGRRDYAKNLAYEALALPLRFHPALWLTRGRIVESREILCDGLAAELLESPQVYARSLVRLAALLLAGRTVRLAHAIGIFDAHSFERRVMQLTRVSSPVHGLRAAILLTTALTFGLGTCASALALSASILPASILPAPTPVQTASLLPVPRQEASLAAQNTPARISGGVMAGNIVSKTQPVYPADAKKAGIQGSVVLHAVIGKDGTVEDLTVISGPPELATSALDAVSKWVYKPYLLNGEPVEVETTITVNYSFGN
jgi:TonB family protein